MIEEKGVKGFIKTNWYGIVLCFAIAVLADTLSKIVPVVGSIIGGPVFAIIFGMIITMFIKNKERLQPGITFTSKKILQYAVILLGFGLNLSTILQTGAKSLPIIITTITTSLVVSFLLYKIMKVPSKISTLVGVGSSICGGSAIAATAPVIEADDEEIAQSISVIFLFNIIAAIIFPTLGGVLGLSNEGFALFAGTAINDTSSVTAAASSWDSIHGTGTSVLDSATIVKLTRTLAIIPITLVLALVRSRKAKKQENSSGTKFSFKKVFPFFIIYFVCASVITTLCTTFLPEAVQVYTSSLFSILKQLSKFFIVMAMAAIGLNTNIAKLVKTGGKPIIMGLCCWLGIAGASLLMQHILSIW